MAIIERDEKGRIVKSSLSKEEATERGKKGYTVKKAESRGQLLLEAGYPDEDTAPEHLKLLAGMAQNNVAAMAAWIKLTRGAEDTQEPIGNTCPYHPTCILFVARGGRSWEPGEQHREVEAARARVRKHREASVSTGNGRDGE